MNSEYQFPKIEDAILFTSLTPSFEKRSKLFKLLKTHYEKRLSTCSESEKNQFADEIEYKKDLAEFYMLYNGTIEENEAQLSDFKQKLFKKVHSMQDDNHLFKRQYEMLKFRLMSRISMDDWQAIHDGNGKSAENNIIDGDQDRLITRIQNIKRSLHFDSNSDGDRSGDMIIFATLMAEMCHDMGEINSDFSESLRGEYVQAYESLFLEDEKERTRKIAVAHAALRKKGKLSSRLLADIYGNVAPVHKIIDYSLKTDMSVFFTYIRMSFADVCLNIFDTAATKNIASLPCSHFLPGESEHTVRDPEGYHTSKARDPKGYPEHTVRDLEQQQQHARESIQQSIDRLKTLLAHLSAFHYEFHKRGYESIEQLAGHEWLCGVHEGLSVGDFEKRWCSNFRFMILTWVVYLYHKLGDDENELEYGMELYKLPYKNHQFEDTDSEEYENKRYTEYILFSGWFYEQYLFDDYCHFYFNTWCYNLQDNDDNSYVFAHDAKHGIEGLKEKITDKYPNFIFGML